MDKSIYKLGIISVAIIIALYVIAILGRVSFDAITVISLVLILPLIVVAVTAFLIGYGAKGKFYGAVWGGIIFAFVAYLATISLSFPFGEKHFVSKMKTYSASGTGLANSLAGNIKGNIYWNIIWIIVAAILFVSIGFSIKKHKKS